MGKEYIGCDGLQQAVDAGDVKRYLKIQHTTTHPAESYFILVRTGIGKKACDYFGAKAECVLLGAAIVDTDDGQTWDYYEVWCPTGPPCKYCEDVR
jgi:hypothetical protein